MKKFVVIYHAPVSDFQRMANPTPEQMQEGLDGVGREVWRGSG